MSEQKQTGKLDYAGQFELTEILWLAESGISVDIRNQVDQITIYEDIFSPVMSGNLVILDTLDLAAEMTNAGADILRITLTTPGLGKDLGITRYFHIHRLSDKKAINERSSSYVLHFVSYDSYTESSNNVSRTFKGKAEDNIQYLLKNYIRGTNEFNFHATTNEIAYTSNYWSPFSNITYNCDHAISAVDGTPSMLFFDSRSGYQMRSLAALSNDTKVPYMYFNANDMASKLRENKLQIGDVQRDFTQDFGTVLTLDAQVYFDYYKDKLDGSINSRMFSFDFTTKRVIDKTFKAYDDTRKRGNPTVMYSNKTVDDSFRGSFGTIPMMVNRHQKLYNGVNDTTDFAIKQKRIALLRQFQQHKVIITVLGRTDYTVGLCVNLNVNKMRQFTKDTANINIADPMLTGNYVISAVAHRFMANGKHECTIELMRDSLGKA